MTLDPAKIAVPLSALQATQSERDAALEEVERWKTVAHRWRDLYREAESEIPK